MVDKKELDKKYYKLFDKSNKLDDETILKKLNELSLKKHFLSNYALASVYYYGEHGLKIDYKKAAYYYEKAFFYIEKGDSSEENYVEDCLKGIKYSKYYLKGKIIANLYMIYFVLKFAFLEFIKKLNIKKNMKNN